MIYHFWYSVIDVSLTHSLLKSCNFTTRIVRRAADARPNDIHGLPVGSRVSEIAQILSLYGGGFLSLMWKS